jgi:hypothetical protein
MTITEPGLHGKCIAWGECRNGARDRESWGNSLLETLRNESLAVQW